MTDEVKTDPPAQEEAAAAPATNPADIVVPEATLEKVDKPNDAEYKKARGKIEGEIKRHQNRLTAIKDQLDRDSEARKSGSDERGIVISKLQGFRATLNGLFDKNKALRAQLDACNNKKKALLDKLKGERTKLRFNSEAEVDEAIRRVEESLHTSSLTLKEEKDLVAEIATLRASKRVIGGYAAQKKAVDDEDAKGKAILTEIKANSAEIDKVRAQESKEKANLEAIKAKQGERKAPTLLKERDEVRKQINKLYGEKKKLYEANEKKWSAYKAYEKEQRKIRDAQRAKDRAERAARGEPAEEEAAEEGEDGENDTSHLHPWADEMYACDQLLTYLRNLLPKAEKAADSGPADAPAPEGAQVIGKKHTSEQGYMAGLQKSKSKKNKGKKKAAPDADGALNHTLDVIGQFAEFELVLPENRANVQSAIDAVTAKKEEFKAKTKEDKDAFNKAKSNKKEAQKPREKKQVAPEYIAPSPGASAQLAGAWASRAAVAK
eukprot:TRINITY_DN134_c1_g1_i1.p1 TRINITY_DN134_c1_g1~~TRINITY_DN134_c1_g1_i1.p1  ORF type:complete len:493 (+),score=251.57 TRINITY_DN134_c1_g1_i1:316-1794(+)